MKMEPNKIEEQFKQMLNSRELQPSNKAWDRLDAMLTVAEEKKTKRSFGWLYIAASILVLATAGMFLFNQGNEEVDNQRTIVNSETKSDTVINIGGTNQIPIVESNTSNEALASSEQIQHLNNKTQIGTKKSIINQKTNIHSNQIHSEKVIEYNNKTEIVQKDTPIIIESNKSLINKESILKTDTNLLVDLDNVAKQSANKKKTIKVDARNLLSQVDGEVEYTFREKVFTKINKNYQEIKVAIVNRNKE